MRKISRWLIITAATILSIACLAVPADAAGVSIKTPVVTPQGSVFGVHAFSPQAPSWAFGDSNGSGTIQINYSTTPFRINTGYRLSATNVNLCHGTHTLDETVDILGNGVVLAHDHHTLLPCDYLAHGSFPVGNTSTNYVMKIHETFRFVLGNSTGTATLDAQAKFFITLV